MHDDLSEYTHCVAMVDAHNVAVGANSTQKVTHQKPRSTAHVQNPVTWLGRESA